jgi:hypothetical protein
VTDNDQGTRNSILRWWSDNLDNWKWPGLFGTAKLLPSESKGIKTVPYSPSPVNIDGAMDNVWTGKPWMEMNQVITGEENLLSPDDLHILWNAVWDKNYLYFLFDLNDDILCTDNSEDYWSDDCIEFWIDGDNSKNYTPDEKNDFGFQFGYDTYSIIKTVKQVLGPIVELSCIKEAAQVTSDGLMIEVAFPLEELGIEPYDSTLFGIDIDYDDDDDGGDQDSKVKMFAQHDEDWLNPSDWGTFMLLGSGMIKNVPLLSPFNRLRESRCTISPNPVASMLNIDFEEITRDEKIEITISDIAGKTIYNNTCTSLSGRLNTSVDMSTIPNGIYLLAIKSNDYYTTEKIIKTD